MKTDKLWSPYPDQNQELLLKACLLDGKAALVCWNEWRSLNTVDELDFATQRLLPLAHQNLTMLGARHPDLERYASVARYIWYENQLRLRMVTDLLVAFGNANIPIMVLKGYAIAPLYYKNWGLRGASDFDILAPSLFAASASQLLNQKGWTSSCAKLLLDARYRVSIHAASFTNEQGAEIDLHWRVLNEFCDENAEIAFWNHAQAFHLNAVPSKTLSSTDHLLHSIVHAMRPNTVSPIRWVADCAMILRASQIDWPRFLKQVVHGRFGLRIHKALFYLKYQFLLPIPEFVLNDLALASPSRLEKVEDWLSRDSVPPVLSLIGWRYTHYRRIAGVEMAPPNFPSYLQSLWGAPTPLAMTKMGVEFIAGQLMSR